MFDKAFDRGLITFSGDYRLELSGELNAQHGNPYVVETFLQRSGMKIKLPGKFFPDDSLLA
tara:strand:+ start:1380 stop:1562 length:183 start_codon:yes stop_codon:yes gene_type:complete